jgi:hypothetical protein
MTANNPMSTPVSFGLFRRRTDGATFAVWFWGDTAERMQGPITDPDPEAPPTHYDRNAAAFVRPGEWNPLDFEPVGDRWEMHRRRAYLPIANARNVAAGAAFADRVRGDAALRDAVDGTHGQLKSWADAVNRV